MSTDSSFPKIQPPLDPDFAPAILWNRSYLQGAGVDGSERKSGTQEFLVGLEQPNGVLSVHRTQIRALDSGVGADDLRYAERLVKFLLWQRGGGKVFVSGSSELARRLNEIYSPGGTRAFDHQFLGKKLYGVDLQIDYCPASEFPEAQEIARPLGRNLDGCRIGFDLGG